MCIDNTKLSEYNVGNGTLCRVRNIKLKDNAPPHAVQWKNWDGKKVYCTSARFVEYVELERFPESDKIVLMKSRIDEYKSTLSDNWEDDDTIVAELSKMQDEFDILDKARCFKLSPTKTTAVVKVSLCDDVDELTTVKGVNVTQIPINCNDATTGHKLQGMSKDKLIVVNWSYAANWIYVVLSRVRTLNGLYLLKPLPDDCLDAFQVPNDLVAFEQRMRGLESRVLEARRKNMAEIEKSRVDRG